GGIVGGDDAAASRQAGEERLAADAPGDIAEGVAPPAAFAGEIGAGSDVDGQRVAGDSARMDELESIGAVEAGAGDVLLDRFVARQAAVAPAGAGAARGGSGRGWSLCGLRCRGFFDDRLDLLPH